MDLSDLDMDGGLMTKVTSTGRKLMKDWYGSAQYGTQSKYSCHVWITVSTVGVEHVYDSR